MRKLLKITDMKKKELIKRIEALEKIIQKDALVEMMKGDEEQKPCETVAKFKRIAEHAQAITNEIASPKELTRNGKL